MMPTVQPSSSSIIACSRLTMNLASGVLMFL